MKEELLNRFTKFKEDILDSNRCCFPEDREFPSLDLWCLSCKFMNELFLNYPIRDSVGKLVLENVYILEKIKLENIPVDARSDREKEKERLIAYCDLVINDLL